MPPGFSYPGASSLSRGPAIPAARLSFIPPRPALPIARLPTPSPLHGAGIDTYDDHRIAMCFATLGLVVPGIRIREQNCVAKTFPNFFAKLAAPAPGGLGATILDATTGRELTGGDLIAE